ncbi:TolC family outer membrane protein [Novosphingobium mangrovi (ex Huang et al. 2023)]|uniref:TolC family outer membrane protein n=1 Tax=Novosphingobium mangrovi (ex Huang et al. 2023) TaxID=2976432 RepID=A0ABT2I923_9SPHN|nr:TolC family outer membrane protein [Novosphingobium mangrovi (ex Huang et al. 2023)]MCT2401284.1 TolC family outer membrane protein [Novosphingobium mangrovi (ex Huang et al. 2023)]
MSRFGSRAGLLASTVLFAAAAASPVSADTLRDALVMAYQTNPSLQAARAQQRGVDENVPIARASGLPSANADATYTEFLKRSPNSFTSPERALSAGVNLGVPIYSGGAVKNRVKAAKYRVKAGQADLRGSESDIFSAVVAAYMDVIQNEAIVGLNRKNVAVLEVNLQATSDRFEIGDVTRTDVAQSQSRLAVAQSDARAAEANLATARETYIRLVGKAPEALDAPPPLPNLPATPEEAVTTALESNPTLIAAREQTKAAEKDIDVAGASRLPRLSLFASGAYNDYFNTLGGPSSAAFSQTEKTAQAGAQISIPIFQGGLPAAQRRQAQAQASAALENEIAAERGVIAQVRSAYSSWLAANDVIRSSKVAVEAAALSLEGVRAENSVGNRTILDILNAEQESLNAQVRLVTARRNAYVAGFNLLAAMGKAEADNLNLDNDILYDPQANYKRVHGKIFDWDDDPAPVAQSTRTVDTPVQDGEIPEQ